MKIIDGIYFYECGEYTYLRNVNDAKDYLFNMIAYDILDCIRQNPGCQEEDICEALAEIYEVADMNTLREDVKEFVAELAAEHLIMEEQEMFSQKTGICDRIEEMCQRDGRLYSATLELTYRCNEKCVHCYVDGVCKEDEKRELTLDEYRSLLDQLKSMGCIRLLLTGGEVCLRKDFLEIVQYAVSSGFLVDIYSNGIGMTDDQFDKLCALKVNSVSFSLYSADAKVHDSITNIPGSYEKTLKRLMMFKCAGIDTFVKTVVIQQNLDSLKGLFELGKRLNISVNPATNISDSYTGVSKKDFRLNDQVQRIFAAQLLQKYDPVTRQALYRDVNNAVCRAGITTLSIDPYGGVHPCLAFAESAGSVRENFLKDIWEQSPLMNRLRTFIFRDLSEKCGECSYMDTCGVCIGAAYSESGGMLCPNTDSCFWAEANHDAIYNQNK